MAAALSVSSATKVCGNCNADQDFQSMRLMIRNPKDKKHLHALFFMTYLLGTPKLFLELHLQGILDPKQTLLFLRSQELRDWIDKNQLPVSAKNYQNLVGNIQKISETRELVQILLQQSAHLTFNAFSLLIRDFSDSFNPAFLQHYLTRDCVLISLQD